MTQALKQNDHDDHNAIEGMDGFVPLGQNSRENEITALVIESAFKIHRLYGAGLLENAYKQILVYELETKLGLKVEKEKTIPILHEGIKIDAGYRLDLLVSDRVIVELKAAEKILPIHEAQLMTYLRLSGKRLGLLVNFNTRLLKDGIKRIAM